MAGCAPARNGMICSVTAGCSATSARWASCSRTTWRDPTGRRSAPSSTTAHSCGASGRRKISCREARSSPRRAISSSLAADPCRISARAYPSVCSSPGTSWIWQVRITEAAASSPTYGSSHDGRMSEYACHQPGVFASRARFSSAARSSASVTPYRVSRSATSRSLNPTRPCSIRLILECDPRIAPAACSAVIPRDSRSRCS